MYHQFTCQGSADQIHAALVHETWPRELPSRMALIQYVWSMADFQPAAVYRVDVQLRIIATDTRDNTVMQLEVSIYRV